MDQKTVAKGPLKIDSADLTQENLEHDFFQFSTRATDFKNLDQAVHNIVLGIELLEIADGGYQKIENHLDQIKQLVIPQLSSNINVARRSALVAKISLKKKELDQVAESIQFKGKKILDGSLSASRDPDQHLYLIAGVTGSPETRVNFNTGLNIPKISSKTLGLGSGFCSNPEEDFKIVMGLENALGITHRLKQRSFAMRNLLQKTRKSLNIAIENHKAAESAPDSQMMAKEFLRTINNNCFNQ